MREGQESEPLTRRDKLMIYQLVDYGFQHKRIAALFDCNQGRITEAVQEIESYLKE